MGEFSLLAYLIPVLTVPLHPPVTLSPNMSVFVFRWFLMTAFLLSQSLQQRLRHVFCLFMVRLVEPFRQAKKCQPSRSEQKNPSYALWVAVMVGGTGRTGELKKKKKVFVCVCVCGNLCSSSLDLPCCSGNEGNCSRSSKAG